MKSGLLFEVLFFPMKLESLVRCAEYKSCKIKKGKVDSHSKFPWAHFDQYEWKNHKPYRVKVIRYKVSRSISS